MNIRNMKPEIVNITWPEVANMGQEQGEHFMIMFTYFNDQQTQYYLDIPLEKAVHRFNESMNNRSPFEILQEGWDANGYIIPFSDSGEAWLGKGDLFKGMNEYFSDLIMGKNEPTKS